MVTVDDNFLKYTGQALIPKSTDKIVLYSTEDITIMYLGDITALQVLVKSRKTKTTNLHYLINKHCNL